MALQSHFLDMNPVGELRAKGAKERNAFCG
jgi:hypothetical protein